MERAEIYFVDAARAMVESGDYLVPRYKGEPFFDKPPLTYWLMAFAFEAFGFQLWAARLVPVGAALALLAATAWVGRLLFDRETATRGVVVLGTTLLFLSFGRVAMSDMLLAAWSTAAFALGLTAFRAAPRASAAVMGALGAVLGLGFLTKGPIALLLPGLGLLLLARVHRRVVPRAAFSSWTLALTLAAVLGLGWFAAVYLRLGAEPLRYFFLRENLQRFAAETYDNHRSPFYYLGAYLAVGLPWSLLFPLAAARAQGEARLLLGWMGLMVLPHSLYRGKIDYYLLPLLPAGALIVAAYLGQERRTALDRAWTRGAAAVFAVLLCAALGLVSGAPAEWLPVGPWPLALGGVAVFALASTAAVVMRPMPRRILLAFAGSTALAVLALVSSFLPAFHAGQPNRAVLEDVTRELAYRPDAAIMACEDAARVQRDILFATRRAVEQRCDLWSVAPFGRPYLILATPREASSLARIPALREVRRYRTLPAAVLTLRGFLEGPEVGFVHLLANYPTADPVAEAKRKKERRQALQEE